MLLYSFSLSSVFLFLPCCGSPPACLLKGDNPHDLIHDLTSIEGGQADACASDEGHIRSNPRSLETGQGLFEAQNDELKSKRWALEIKRGEIYKYTHAKSGLNRSASFSFGKDFN